ncbi:MAG: DUF3727 domain-containing protein [Synechococcales cyanobacterium RU_4_20]|nr:DUF3727 domain-containing protein [Synechococcales cyanobacterium RU_4_20]NJR70818.1 DUF3727 domain-containing protein [Synechococcales cyanobacterium CRU_2_2]
MDAPTVLLHDTDGRSLLCFLERSLVLEGQPYGLLQPVDAPAVIFSWQDDDEEPVPVEEDSELKALFPTAKAVLEEQNLTLLPTAITLTVEGDLPDLEDEEDEEADLNGADHYGFDDEDELDEEEEFQLLAIFYYQEREYGIYTPLDPFLIVARLENEEPKLISEEEYARIEPLLEAELAKAIAAEEKDAVSAAELAIGSEPDENEA